jgi:hypothetical protein
MNGRPARLAQHGSVAMLAAALLFTFAGVALAQVVTGAPQSHGGPTSPSTTGGSTTGGGNGQKVQICHKTHSKKHPAHTIWVSKSAEQSFLARGDHEGKCTDGETRPATTTTTTTKPDHGNQGNGGGGNRGGGKGK